MPPWSERSTCSPVIRWTTDRTCIAVAARPCISALLPLSLHCSSNGSTNDRVGRRLGLRCLSFALRDDFGAPVGVDNSLPPQRLDVRSRAGDGGDVPQMIARPRIGAACANALDQSG